MEKSFNSIYEHVNSLIVCHHKHEHACTHIYFFIYIYICIWREREKGKKGGSKGRKEKFLYYA